MENQDNSNKIQDALKQTQQMRRKIRVKKIKLAPL